MKKKISWEAWIDPFCSNISKFHHNPAIEEKLEENDDEPEFDMQSERDNIFSQFVDKQYESEAINKIGNSGRRVFTSAIGLIPMMDHHYVSNNFSLWIGHTNFDITKSVADTIESVNGVETLEIYSRYRFRVSIGRLFDFQEVRLEIENSLCGNRDSEYRHTLSDNLKEKIDTTIKDVKSQYKYWGICLLPNGETKVVKSKIKNDDFQQELLNLELIRTATDGILFTYQD